MPLHGLRGLHISFPLKTRRMANCLGNIQPWTCSCFKEQRGKLTVIRHRVVTNKYCDKETLIKQSYAIRRGQSKDPMKRQIETWQGSQITDNFAKLVIYKAFVEDELDCPKHIAKYVHQNFFNPQHEDFAPRTMWSLQNGFTSAFQVLDAIPRYRATADFARFFEN